MSTLNFLAEQSAPIALSAKFACEPGQMLALVGPSGSGKSSILRVIAGLLRPATGTVSMGAQVWFDSARGIWLSPQRRRVGMVFQSYALFPHMSALENVAIAAGRDARVLERARHWLQKVSMAEYADRRPAQLSGGQQQRVALARALVREPSVLLLDEPFSAVDQVIRQSLHVELARLKNTLSMPIIFVTHDLHEASTLADTMVIVDRGETLQQGVPRKLIASPRNARVANLIGIQNHFAGVFRGGAGTGHGTLWWGGQPNGIALAVIDKGRIDDGQAVTWVVSGEHISIESERAGAAADAPTAIHTRVEELGSLGEVVISRLSVNLLPGQVIQVTLTAKQVRDLALQVGSPVLVRFESAGIHVMPQRGQR